jgi:arsenite methyltransferase
VLKPGGRVGVSDIVAEDHLSADDRAERGSDVGCIAGALSKSEYLAGLQAAGFSDPQSVLSRCLHSRDVPRSPKRPGGPS